MVERNEGVNQACGRHETESDHKLVAIVHHYDPGSEKKIKAAKSVQKW